MPLYPSVETVAARKVAMRGPLTAKQVDECQRYHAVNTTHRDSITLRLATEWKALTADRDRLKELAAEVKPCRTEPLAILDVKAARDCTADHLNREVLYRVSVEWLEMKAEIERKDNQLAAMDTITSQRDEMLAERDKLAEKLKGRDDEARRLYSWIDDLQSGMYVNCVYCGHRYGPSDEVPASMADVLTQHVESCPKHPMSTLKTERDRLAGELLGSHRLAYHVARAVQRGGIGTRSQIGDTLLDFLDIGGPDGLRDVPAWIAQYEAKQATPEPAAAETQEGG